MKQANICRLSGDIINVTVVFLLYCDFVAEDWQQNDHQGQLIVEATSDGGGCKLRRCRRPYLGVPRRSMTSPEVDVVAVVGPSQGEGQGQSRRRNNCTPHTQLGPEAKRRRAVTSSDCEYCYDRCSLLWQRRILSLLTAVNHKWSISITARVGILGRPELRRGRVAKSI